MRLPSDFAADPRVPRSDPRSLTSSEALRPSEVNDGEDEN